MFIRKFNFCHFIHEMYNKVLYIYLFSMNMIHENNETESPPWTNITC